jgi:hypothetical protein
VANPEQVVRVLLEDDGETDARRWPEFAGMSNEEWENYAWNLPRVWLLSDGDYALAYGLDLQNDFLIATDDDPSYRFANPEEMHQFLDRMELSRASFEDAEIDTEKHIYSYAREPDVPKYSLEQKRAHVVYEYGGYIFIKLPEDPDFIRREGIDQEQCLAVAHRDYCERMKKGEIEVYSMTDATTGKPVVDIEVALTKGSYSRAKVERPAVTQVRGIRNEMPPRDEYLEPLMVFFQKYGESKGWQLIGHGVRNFDGRADGEMTLARWQELQDER